MRVCILKETGRLLEAQSGDSAAGLRTLIANASALGYTPSEIIVKIVDDQEFARLLRLESSIWFIAAKMNELSPQFTLPELAEILTVPEVISDRQFYQQLANLAIITQEEALAANAATIPAALLTMVTAYPEEEQFGAKMLLGGATEFNRHHPLTEAIGAAYGWTQEQIDAFFQQAATL